MPIMVVYACMFEKKKTSFILLQLKVKDSSTSLHCIFLCVVFYNNCTVHGADLTHISLLVIYSLYNRVCDK